MRAFTVPFTSSQQPLKAARRSASSRRTAVTVRAEQSVQDLLARDRKLAKAVPDMPDKPPAGKQQFSGDTPIQDVLDEFESSDKTPRAVKSKKQRRQALVDRTDKAVGEVADADRPKRCKEAIDAGLELFKQKKYQAAINMFNLALELPGNGAYRLSGSPREYSCPSDAEETACLYNTACAYAQMGEKAAALTCLEAILESGFEDYANIRSDPDLAPLRGAQLDQLLGKYDNPLNTVKKMLPGSKKEEGEKPWWLW